MAATKYVISYIYGLVWSINQSPDTISIIDLDMVICCEKSGNFEKKQPNSNMVTNHIFFISGHVLALIWYNVLIYESLLVCKLRWRKDRMIERKKTLP
jgi:hypothetical protein